VNALERSLVAVAADLRAIEARFALVGGLAVAVRSEPRLTRDVDLAVAVRSDREAEHVVHELVRRGYAVVATVEQGATGRLATARLTGSTSDPGIVIDLLFASAGIEPEIVAAAEEIEILPKLTLPVASIGHLIAMKLLARDDRQRPTDADDLRALAHDASAADWRQAADAIELIQVRGYHRDRDLASALTVLRERGPY
jgi:hypothetical protein